MYDINVVLKLIYTVFLGALIALFVGMGIFAFYPAPKAPDYPMTLQKSSPDTETDIQAREKLDADQKAYQKEIQPYSRNFFIIATIAAVILLVISLSAISFVGFLADGILLGGVFTLGYAVILSMGNENDKFRFIAVSVGLVVAVTLGYLKFVKQSVKVSK